MKGNETESIDSGNKPNFNNSSKDSVGGASKGEVSKGEADSVNKDLLAYMSKTFNVRRDQDISEKDEEDEDDDDEEEDGDDSNQSYQSYFTSTDQDSEYDKSIDEDNKILQEGVLIAKNKVIIFFAILSIAVCGALAATYLVRKQDNDVTEENIYGFSVDVATKSQANLDQIFAATFALSRTIATTVQMANATYPYVSLPHFEVYGGEARQMANVDLIAFCPLVKEINVDGWEVYSQLNQQWIVEGLRYEHSNVTSPGWIPETLYTKTLPSHNHKSDAEVHLPGYHLPLWQMSSAPRNASIVNLDLIGESTIWEHNVADVIIKRKPLLSSVQDLRYITDYLVDPNPNQNTTSSSSNQRTNGTGNLPIEILNPLSLCTGKTQSYVMQPIFDQPDAYFTSDGSGVEDNVMASTTRTRSSVVFPGPSSFVAGFVVAIMNWTSIFENILPEGINGMNVVVDDGCGYVMTYLLDGPQAVFVGTGDLHDTLLDSYLYTVNDFGGLAAAGFDEIRALHPTTGATSYNEEFNGTANGHCQYTLSIYPTADMQALYNTDQNANAAAVVVSVVILILLVLCVYDCLVTRRQRHLLAVANQTNTLIASLFPRAIQKRIFEEAAATANRGSRNFKPSDFEDVLGESSQAQLEGVLQGFSRKKAIADYFPSATIFFGDMVGFTAWSSTRDPAQVFQLLETIYQAFDEIAKRRKVFKVETVGDCYVAATGLPEQRSDHAVLMARFARDCLSQFMLLVRQMEEILGPDTGDLALRIGINSGPVTAGVLRGERSRFQLFGDTVNTAARMESNGCPNRIHLSTETADLLIEAGKKHWVTPRLDRIVAKGKGELQTFWLETKRTISSGASQNESRSINRPQLSDVSGDHVEDDLMGDRMSVIVEDSLASALTDKMQRLVKWNTELLAKSLQIIVARRIDMSTKRDSAEKMRLLEEKSRADARNGKLIFDEVVDIINLPPRKNVLEPGEEPTDPDTVQFAPEVLSQLHDYVRTIAAMYRDNPFHNFEHASHVTMSTSKLMARIVAPEETRGAFALKRKASEDDTTTMTKTLHDNTYGITSDPLTQFAAVFSALIHDVYHPGVPNSVLVEEHTSLAVNYHNKSIAEQNSVDLAWDLFMDPAYEDLRRVLYANGSEFERFRQLVVNLVMATDIMDKELGAFRKARWNKAFAVESDNGSKPETNKESRRSDVNRKATIVLEHLIQASDVSHTMQHWHIFIKWNERLFMEMYRAYREGRSPTDPSANWYRGEIGFFDFYIIPLAKKLESCGVFGVSSDEYLSYAMKNRIEWEAKGEEQVKMYLRKYHEQEEEQKKVMAEEENQAKEPLPFVREELEAQIKESVKKHLLMLEKKRTARTMAPVSEIQLGPAKTKTDLKEGSEERIYI